ncbi:hypothetical protein CPB84DRAFT_1850037 [Gymnopilus junonius]|uniref:Uncharacterized protein n=1 Tax=Gymnopilus junonius TaxID=109634 RepID=A0A9P5TJ24_GYMJU|nr:hypothetical protein CPB84DRAFT_1850037 [Gymnopilus junonius]
MAISLRYPSTSAPTLSEIITMSATVFTGKFNYSPYASNENFFLTFVDGWVERGQVLVFSTFTKDAAGVDKRPFDLTTKYVLVGQDQYLTKFTINDLDKKAYYFFNGTRNADGTVTLTLVHGSSNLATINLTKLN